ncbi:MAG: polyprenol monophosphomannose synthase [Fidelibacterota bacterium]|nr:MAG: polyprenol monophosphomannose synthase [Candidatus Neomarinimicrobiota bacterium]
MIQQLKTLIITPTYNERDNIEVLLSRIHEVAPQAHVLVVDDNSPDGTGAYVKERSAEDGWVHLIERPEKQGLGTAYCRGFTWALENEYDAIIQMDADLSHDPDQIPDLLRHLSDYDLVIGSRYIQGVNVVNWPLSRLVLSWSANIYAKVITGVPVWDLTGGYKCWRREVLANLDIPSIKSEGYSFQIETTFRAYNQGYRIKESPIVFVDRTEGASKMSKGIIYEAVWMVPRLRLSQIARVFRRIWFKSKEFKGKAES